jgi:hypothetical protein
VTTAGGDVSVRFARRDLLEYQLKYKIKTQAVELFNKNFCFC